MGEDCSNGGDIHGYDCNFEPAVDRKYYCPICLVVLRDAVQTKCGHRFCDKCLKGVIRDRAHVKCPVDNTTFTIRSELFADNATRREVLSLGVRCEHEYCPWKGELRHLQEHIASCPLAPVTCEFKCGTIVTRAEMDNHKAVCRRRPVKCSRCDQTLLFADRTKHHLLECEKFPVTCSYCGDVGILRKNITEHLQQDCPLMEVNCSFAKLGCNAKEKRQNLAKHNKEHCQMHMELMMQWILSLETQKSTWLRKVLELSVLVNEQQLDISALRRELLISGARATHHRESALEPDDVETTTDTISLMLNF